MPLMRVLLFSAMLCLLPTLCATAQNAAPVEVTTSAVAAVKALGDQVLLGNHIVAVERMYPEWKQRAAKDAGGMEKLEEQLKGLPAMMAQQGVQLISFRPKGSPVSYEVSPGKKVVKEGGKDVEKLIYQKWLVLVPTLIEYRIAKPSEGTAAPQFVVIQSSGFQIAVSDKDSNTWSFIDGASIKASELLGLFGTLPANLEFPPVERKVLEGK